MKSVLKISSYFLIAFIFCIALSGCTNSKQAVKQKITIWGFESEDVWKNLISVYSSKNKNIDFVYRQQTLGDDYENRFLNSILSGNGPDIVALPNETIYRHKDKLVPMPEDLASKFDLDDYVPAIKQSVYFNQKIYALSPTAEPLMIYYNPKLFDALQEKYSDYTVDSSLRTRISSLTSSMPKTWTDWIDLAKWLTIKDSSGQITQSGAAIGTDKVISSQDILYLLMTQNETQIISDNLKLATFNLPKTTPPNQIDYPGRNALDFYTTFSNPASDNYVWSDSIGNSLDAFVSGKVAMIFGYSNLQNYFEQKYPEFVYRKGFVPQQSQDATKIVDFARFNGFAVSKLTLNPAICWSIVQDVTESTSIDIGSASNLFTSTRSGTADVSIMDRDSNNPERVSLVTAKSLVRGRYPTEFDQSVRSAIASVIGGAQTSAAALDTSAELVTRLLNKTEW